MFRALQLSTKNIQQKSQTSKIPISTFKKLQYCFAASKQPLNPYKILGIEPGADQKEIKKKYVQLVKKYHPDKNEGYQDLFKQIQEAYDILNSAEK